jgi:hypothetical protein
MEETIIYVEMFDEAVRVFVPVPSLHLGDRYYKVLEHNRSDYETLRFETGIHVFCLPTKLIGTEELVPLAYCEVSKEEAESMATQLKIQK